MRSALLILLEVLGLSISGLLMTILLLGHFGNLFSGTDPVHNLLPFAGVILGLAFSGSILLVLWIRFHRWSTGIFAPFPSVLALLMPLLLYTAIPKTVLSNSYINFRTLVGGKEEVGREVIAHQVYAAYRRLDISPLTAMIKRATPFAAAIQEAAAAYDLDTDLLNGLAATESSFLPRPSNDGGEGLFQITRVPTQVTREVDTYFVKKDRQHSNPRYNAFLGAATLRHYLDEVRNDLFLGLLAYNIGPANGGLRDIMQQYGATDFTTIQPYLSQLPRDYPIRVLANSLAFRINRKAGQILAYEEADNARTIQAIGIPWQ